MRCDYYVVKKGELSKRCFCADYAARADQDGAAGRAAWYWLLSGEPKKALRSVKNALVAHHDYAAEYGAFAAIVLHDRKTARKYWQRFKKSVVNWQYALEDKRVVEKLYPTADFSGLVEGK